MPKTRYVILGDPHIHSGEMELWQRNIDDINALEPLAVLVMGDLSGGYGTGSSEALDRAVKVLDKLTAPWQSIIGNHDLQSEQFSTDDAAVSAWLKRVGRNTPWFSWDLGPLQVIGLSNTQWRGNLGNKNEIVLGEAQMDWWRKELKRLKGRPVLILGHTPTTGAGIITLTELHCQVGNAFTNENHFPGEVQRVIHENPNVLFWFSGHNHMGQHYRDAITLRQGVHYVHTGTASRSASRDGKRHSRVLEIDERSITIRTFDHAARRIDESLDHHEPYALNDFLNYRKVYLGKRHVPRDPATMRQGPGGAGSAPSLGAVRFAFLSDAHVVAKINQTQQRLIDWALEYIKGRAADRAVLGGDITHHANSEHAGGFLDALSLGALPIDYLPGNNEGGDFHLDSKRYPNVRVIKGCQAGGEGWPSNTFFLQTTCAQDAEKSLQALLEQWPKQGNILVLAHFPPDRIPGAVEKLTQYCAKYDQHLWWLCGHIHTNQKSDVDNLHVRICAGLDPIKTRGCRPTFFMVDWDGKKPVIHSCAAPLAITSKDSSHAGRIGLACRNSAADLIHAALKQAICVLQFHYSLSKGEVTEQEQAALAKFRRHFPNSFLSLHLPNFPAYPEKPDIKFIEPWLNWAQQAGLDDLTIHLPKVQVANVFDEQGDFLKTDWVIAMQETYIELAQRALDMGAQLSLENIYNKQRVGPSEEKLSTRPWHLNSMVDFLREALLDRGYSAGQVEKIGIIFDVGHAFRDATISKVHGIGDWLERISAYWQLSHIHQVGIAGDGTKTNHQPIADISGPLINYAGVLDAMNSATATCPPLLIEVRDCEQALESYGALIK